jgi:hypothetical protein
MLKEKDNKKKKKRVTTQTTVCSASIWQSNGMILTNLASASQNGTLTSLLNRRKT